MLLQVDSCSSPHASFVLVCLCIRGSDDQDSQVEEDFYMTHEPIDGRPTDWSRNAIYFHYHDVSGRSRRNWKHGEGLKMEAAARRAAEHKAYLEKERQIEALRHAAFLGLNLEVTEEELVRRDQAQFLTSELEHTDATITYLQVWSIIPCCTHMRCL